MKQILPILILVCSAWAQAGEPPRPAAAQAPPQAASQVANSAPVPADQENARKAKALVDQGIQALGGQAYLTLSLIHI